MFTISVKKKEKEIKYLIGDERVSKEAWESDLERFHKYSQVSTYNELDFASIKKRGWITAAEANLSTPFVCLSCKGKYYSFKELKRPCPFCGAAYDFNPEKMMEEFMK